jgi:chromosome segregation ATPase
VSLLPPKVKERIGEAEEEIHRLQGEVTKHAQTNRQAFDALDEAKDEMAKAKEELEVQIKECERLRLERDSARKLAETKNAEVSALHQQIAEMKMKSSSAENPNTPVKHGSPRKPRRTFALSASPFA